MFSLLPPLVEPNQIAHSICLLVTQSSDSDFWLMISETVSTRDVSNQNPVSWEEAPILSEFILWLKIFSWKA